MGAKKRVDGGLSNNGKLTINNSTISENINRTDKGGGISNSLNGTLSLTDSIVTHNSANGGGGIANSGVMTLSRILVAGNRAIYHANDYGNIYPGGGGIYNQR